MGIEANKMDSLDNRRLVVISPTAPPNICGVSDYSFLTAQEIIKFYRSASIGVVDVPQSSGVNDNGALKIGPWEEMLRQAADGPTDLLLHYTPTSYAWTGLPISLIQAMRRFKKTNPDNRIFIFFHELWSNSLSLKFHQIARNQLAKWSSYQMGSLADGISTLTNGQKKDLEAILKKPTIQLGLVGANITPTYKEIGLRSERQTGVWAVFGLAHTRLWALQAHLPLLKNLHEQGSLVQLHSIGPADNSYAREEAQFIEENFGKNVLVQFGSLQPEEVSRQLLHVEAAIVKQDADSLYKSGSFSALAAHAVPVVCEVPTSLNNPPGKALFRPNEVQENPEIIRNEEGKKRRQQLHNWFWSTRSWEAIGQDMHTWMS